METIDRRRATGDWDHLHPLLQLTFFFQIQHGICKWGGAHLHAEVDRRAFLSFFLTTCGYTILLKDPPTLASQMGSKERSANRGRRPPRPQPAWGATNSGWNPAACTSASCFGQRVWK